MPRVKAIVKQTDMLEELQNEAVNCAYDALGKASEYKEIARIVRCYFDNKYGRSWSCFVGKDYGTSFAYDKKHLISFELEGKTFLLFRGA